jgi:hypothetical protein
MRFLQFTEGGVRHVAAFHLRRAELWAVSFHVLPSQHREDHLQQLRKAGIDVEAAQRARQLEIALPEAT